jgi:cysteinyl-tRNA synthetase
MSKSLGNFTTIRQLLDAPDAPDSMAVRLFLLQGQYRKPVDFTKESIEAAQNSWQTLREGLLFGYQFGEKLGWTDVADKSFGDPAAMRIDRDTDPIQAFQVAMDDDFNTAGGLAVLFELAKDLRRAGNLITHAGKADTEAETLRQQWQTLVCLAQVLGLEAKPAEPSETNGGLSDAEIETLLEQRREARKAKDFGESDRIRNQLQAQGITLIDKPGGVTEWHR